MTQTCFITYKNSCVIRNYVVYLYQLRKQTLLTIKNRIMKTAYFSKKFHILTYFVQPNVTENVNCYTAKEASLIIKNSGINQNLIIY
jgi:hypothetical protein